MPQSAGVASDGNLQCNNSPFSDLSLNLEPDVQIGRYTNCSVALIGNSSFSRQIAELLASGGISELSLAATDLLAPPSSPISTFHPVHDWMSERRLITEAARRRNNGLSIVEFSHGHMTGPHWQRCATARADLVVSVDGDATSRLVNLICMQQVTPALYAGFDDVQGVGEISFVIPRCSGLQYRGFPATSCWECSHTQRRIRQASHDGLTPEWFSRILMRYVDAILREHDSDFAGLLAGPNVLIYGDNTRIASASAVVQERCLFCS